MPDPIEVMVGATRLELVEGDPTDVPADAIVNPANTAGPRLGEGNEDEKLAAATRNALALAEERGLRWAAMPAISTGVFGYRVDRCAAVMLGTAIAFLLAGSHLERVTFCLRGTQPFRLFAAELDRHEIGAGERPAS